MNNIAERYTRLCNAYIQLADQFQKLDVEHMTLRGKMVPFLKALKAYKKLVEELQHEKFQLEQQLQDITAKYENLRSLEVLLQPEHQAALAEAEEQIELVAETLQEMERDQDPDLSEAERTLLSEYYNMDEFSVNSDLPPGQSNVLPFAS
jgi:predicted  nucleic acid-binding Zn-ribbon protein